MTSPPADTKWSALNEKRPAANTEIHPERPSEKSSEKALSVAVGTMLPHMKPCDQGWKKQRKTLCAERKKRATAVLPSWKHMSSPWSTKELQTDIMVGCDL